MKKGRECERVNERKRQIVRGKQMQREKEREREREERGRLEIALFNNLQATKKVYHLNSPK